jgi:hypothetical protein
MQNFEKYIADFVIFLINVILISNLFIIYLLFTD